jgi:hypothetical protein
MTGTTADPLKNGLIAGVGDPIMLIARFYRIMYEYEYIYSLKFATTAVRYCINNNNEHTQYTNITNLVVSVDK